MILQDAVYVDIPESQCPLIGAIDWDCPEIRLYAFSPDPCPKSNDDDDDDEDEETLLSLGSDEDADEDAYEDADEDADDDDEKTLLSLAS